MPVVARFYGIVIKMYYLDHAIPGFHSVYPGYNGVFAIDTVEMIEGEYPSRARKVLSEWAHMYRDEL